MPDDRFVGFKLETAQFTQRGNGSICSHHRQVAQLVHLGAGCHRYLDHNKSGFNHRCKFYITQLEATHCHRQRTVDAVDRDTASNGFFPVNFKTPVQRRLVHVVIDIDNTTGFFKKLGHSGGNFTPRLRIRTVNLSDHGL